jgi:2-succinyl-6-hydroxy-2,4-cyclohexadiene-1-carboxylate synthase
MRVEVHGLVLHAEIVGEGPPLLLLHGFTASTATWDPLRSLLAPRFRLLALDLIGHGRSDAPADVTRYTLEQCSQDVVAALDALGRDDGVRESADPVRAVVLGYSMGGRLALRLAVDTPERVAALILVGVSPGLAGVAEREERRRADEALAEMIEREGIAAFVDHWEHLPLFASQAALPAEVRAAQRYRRLRNTAMGLANSLRGMGTGSQEPLWDRLPALYIPTLLVAGELDAKYRDVAVRMARVMPAAHVAIVPNAGHAVHLEQPDALAGTVLEFVRTVARGGK